VRAKLGRVEISEPEITQVLAQAKALLPAPAFEKIEKVVLDYSTLLKVLADKNTSLKRLRRMLFGPTSEKGPGAAAAQGCAFAGTRGGEGRPKKPPPGHGRNGADAYPGARTEAVAHPRLKSGDRCPSCRKGKVYDQRGRPGTLVRLLGQAPIAAMIYLLQKLRCNLCGKIFQADPPAGVERGKYDATASSMIALLKYGGGFPWNRLDKLQAGVGVPLPAATQWGVACDAARKVEPVYEELRLQAAQGRVLHNDDTGMKILERMGLRREAAARGGSNGAANGRDGRDPGSDRTGTFTSGIVSLLDGRQIALFFTGLKHAGENLQALLEKRDPGLAAPIQMCDALSRNVPKDCKTLLANCLAHARRQFFELTPNFPAECEHVLRVLAKVYENDATCKKREVTDIERLRFHQERSAPLMENLRAWLGAHLAEKRIEPNSTMGAAIEYVLKRWEPLTLFLRKAGAPLDNNVVERILKKAILHRKNSMFYKTDKGARVGDVFMSLIHTCELNGVDPFDYLTELQRHAKEVRAHPQRWLPWTYHPATARPPPR
jgi:hypothetical protein